MNYIEKLVTKAMIWFIVRGYGCNCETCDLDDFPDMYKKPIDVFVSFRCPSCRAREVKLWLEEHLDLLNDK